MIAHAPIRKRLEGAGFRRVAGIVEWTGLKAMPAHSPALFVITDRETARPSDRIGIHDQRVAELFRVITVIKPSARADGKPSDELKEEVDKVIATLAGWQHPDASGPCDYAGGRLLSADGWGIAWASDFTTTWRIRKEIQ